MLSYRYVIWDEVFVPIQIHCVIPVSETLAVSRIKYGNNFSEYINYSRLMLKNDSFILIFHCYNQEGTKEKNKKIIESNSSYNAKR